MKLLILTQKVDRNDDILGFFHGWIEKLAGYFEQLTVICLQKGEYSLPKNVKVFSLGKEEKIPKLIYIKNFYKYAISERDNYDAVFVHMNPEYVILGGLLWKILKKEIFFWYNHKKGGVRANIAAFFADKIFYTSSLSFFANHKKSKIMPAGIDIEKFKADPRAARNANSILFLGRVSPVKNIDILIDALKILQRSNVEFTAHIYGDYYERDKDYYKRIRERSLPLETDGKIVFHESVPNYQAPFVYNQNDIFVNLTAGGSFDKTIFEAMACGCLPVACNESLASVLGGRFSFRKNDAIDLAGKIKPVLNLSAGEKKGSKKRFREYIEENHSLDLLIKKLIKEIEGQD